jgi:hypothetical protein
MDRITCFTQLDVWKISHSLVLDTYKYIVRKQNTVYRKQETKIEPDHRWEI